MSTLDYLVVDDDETFRSRVVRALSDRRFSAAGAPDVEQALQILRDFAVRRVILDLKMPGRSGLQLLEQLTADESGIEIVVLTGYGSIATAMNAIRLGAKNYVQKPLSVDQILAAFESEQSPFPPQTVPVPSLEQLEWDHIQRVVHDCGGNISQAAGALGLHRRSLQRKLQKSPRALK